MGTDTKLAKGEPVYLSRDPRIALTERRPSFESFANQWFETYVQSNAKLSTRLSYRCILDTYLIPRFGALDLQAVTTPLIEEFKAERLRAGNGPKTVNNFLIVLRRCQYRRCHYPGGRGCEQQLQRNDHHRA